MVLAKCWLLVHIDILLFDLDDGFWNRPSAKKALNWYHRCDQSEEPKIKYVEETESLKVLERVSGI